MSNYDVSIVIPSYDEGRDIDRTLVRIAALVDKLSKRIKVAVFVVINNSSRSTAAIKRNNLKTSQFLGEVEEGRQGKEIKKRRKRDANIIKYLTKSRVNFIEVDLFRGDIAPEVCNVGIARGVGFRAASGKTTKNGILIGTDADTLLGKEYLKQALKLRHEQRYGALTGPVKVYSEECLMNDDQKVVDLIESLWLTYIGSPDMESIWTHSGRAYVPHIPGSNLVVQNRVFKAVGTFPEVSGAEDVLFGMHVSLLGEGIDFDEHLSVYTSSRVSLRTPEGHGFGQTMDKKSRALYDIETPYLPSKQFAIVIQEIANFLLLNSDGCLKKDKWIQRFQEVLDKFKITIEAEKIERWYQMLEEFKDFMGPFLHPLVREEVIKEVKGKFPNISLAEAAEEVMQDSPSLMEVERTNLRTALKKAKEMKLGAFGVKFILLYVKIRLKMEELEELINKHDVAIKQYSHIYDFTTYFRKHRQLIHNTLCILLKPYEALIGFEHEWKVSEAKESGVGSIGKMKQEAQAHLIGVDSMRTSVSIKEIQDKITELDMLFPKLYFNIEE